MSYITNVGAGQGLLKVGSLTVFVSNYENLKRKFAQFSVRNQAKIIDIYTNVRYTMFSTLKEVWQCIEK